MPHDEDRSPGAAAQFARSPARAQVCPEAATAADAGADDGALEQARRSVALLESLLDALADGVLALDRRGRVIHWSRSLAALTSIPATEALGRSGGELIGELADRVIAEPRGASNGCLQLPNGRELPVRVVAVRSRGAGGVVVGWVCAVTDLRGRWAERAEVQRETALAELGRGLAELLERDLEGTDAVRLAGKIRDSLEEVDRRIGEVLTFARPRPLDVAAFSARDLVAAVIEQVRARFPNGPAIALEAPEPVELRADRNQLGQALENLLANACEAAGPRGDVRLLLQRVPAGPEPGAGDVRVLIRNTGEQLPPERLQEIFEPFRSGKSGGTGLGLPLARRIVRDHGGRITALSAGGWTTFVVTLPGDVVTDEEASDGDCAGGGIRHEAVG
jgi:signal transduction histidine kinase